MSQNEKNGKDNQTNFLGRTTLCNTYTVKRKPCFKNHLCNYVSNKNVHFSIKQMRYQQQQQQHVAAHQQQQFPNPLINAVRRNDVGLIKRLLSNGVDAKATNNDGETALMFAARKGDNKMVEILLPKSDAKAVSNSGYTALMLAAKYGNIKIVERLLPKSDPKATNWRRETAYDLAKKYHHYQIVRLLKKHI